MDLSKDNCALGLHGVGSLKETEWPRDKIGKLDLEACRDLQWNLFVYPSQLSSFWSCMWIAFKVDIKLSGIPSALSSSSLRSRNLLLDRQCRNEDYMQPWSFLEDTNTPGWPGVTGICFSQIGADVIVYIVYGVKITCRRTEVDA